MGSIADKDQQRWTESPYFMPCDNDESRRLTRQHDFLTQTLRGSLLLLSSSIIARLSQASTEILDVGTGNGVWLSAFYTNISKLPAMTGIDITPHMFPTKHPSTMTFETGSVLALPPRWSDRFDLVHQRLLFAGLTVQQWPVAIREHFRVTRPGGWLHLVEVNLRNMTVGPESTRLITAVRQMFEMNGMDYEEAEQLPKTVSEAGWNRVQVHDREWRLDGSGQKETLARKNALHAHSRMKEPLIKLGLFESEDEFDELLCGVGKEWETIRGDPLILRVITAWKPEH